MTARHREQSDVCVAGAGFAGVAAAVAAARRGLKVVLLEERFVLGGTAAAAKHQHLCGFYTSGTEQPQRLQDGLCRELEETLLSSGRARKVRVGEVWVLEYETAVLQNIFETWIQNEKNLTLKTGLKVEAVGMSGSRIQSITAGGSEGLWEITCGAAVDCSGRGDLIRLSGAAYDIAPAEKRQLAAAAFEVEGTSAASENMSLRVSYALAQAVKSGTLENHLRFSLWLPSEARDRGVLRLSVLPSDSGYNLAQIHQQGERVLAVLRETVTEFKSSVIGKPAERVTEREGIRMQGRYVLTEDDVLSARRFEEGGVRNAWPVEFWDPVTGPRYSYLPGSGFYEIPPGCQQSHDIENLFAAGRCLSATSRALASARVTGTVLALGEQAARLVQEFLQPQDSETRPDLLNIAGLIFREARAFAKRPCLVQDKRVLTYEDLFREVRQLVNDLPFKKYQRVGLLITEGMDSVILNLAILSQQAVAVPMAHGTPAEEVRRVMETIQLDALVYEKKLFSPDEKADVSLFSPVEKRDCGMVLFERTFSEQEAFELLNPAFIRFTSGTTGESKGVVLSHETIHSRTDAAQAVLKMTEKDKVFWVLPMAHHFVVTILLFLRHGAAIYLCPDSAAAGSTAELKAGEMTFLYAAPAFYQRMIQDPELTKAAGRSVRMAVVTTMALDEKTSNAFLEKFGFDLSPAYGIIEAGLPFVQVPGQPEKKGSVGRPAPGYACRLRDPDETGAGGVQIQGPGLFDAYFSPWRLRAAASQDGWFQTGDLGRLDTEGFLTLLGREGGVINFMGMKIFPQEVENVLLQYPGIEKAHVYGRAHSSYGQMPCAKIVLKEKQTAFNEEDLRSFCYARLQRYQVPKFFEKVQALGITLSGKIVLNQREDDHAS